MKKNCQHEHPPEELLQRTATSELLQWSEASWTVKFPLLSLVMVFIHTRTAQACTIKASVSSPPYSGRGVALRCVSTCSPPVGPRCPWRRPYSSRSRGPSWARAQEILSSPTVGCEDNGRWFSLAAAAVAAAFLGRVPGPATGPWLSVSPERIRHVRGCFR